MVCKNCGVQMNKGTAVCPNCGAEIGKLRRHMKKIVVAAAGVAAVAGIGVGIFNYKVKNYREKINLQDYITIDYTGVDGYADARIIFDSKEFTRDIVLGGRYENIPHINTIKSELKSNPDDSVWDITEDCIIDGDISWREGENLSNVTDKIIDSCNYTLDESEDLSNGDILTVTVEVDNETADKYGLKLIGGEFKVEVQGLEQVKKVDLFDSVTVNFSGTAPYANVGFEKALDEYYDFYTVSASKNSNIALGEKIVVTLDVNEEYMRNAVGCIAEETTREYICEGVDTYVTEIGDISDAQMDAMKKQLEDIFYSETADWEENAHVDGIHYEGSYLLNQKPDEVWGLKSAIYLIYKIDVTVDTDEGPDSFSYYYYGQFSNIILTSDGVCSVDVSDCEVPEYGWGYGEDEGFEKHDLAFAGYETIDSLYNYCVTSHRDTYEISVDGDIVP